MTITQVKWY